MSESWCITRGLVALWMGKNQPEAKILRLLMLGCGPSTGSD